MGWKAVISTVAPALATALGGPLAGMAVGAIGSALGLGESASEEQISNALQRPTSEQLLALKKADQDFAIRMRELDVDVQRIHQADRDSARQREANTGDMWTPRVLAAVTLFAFLACVWFVFSQKLTGMDAAQIALIGGVVGYASAKADTVIAYYFGSSSGSEEKNRLLFAASAPEKK